MQNAEHNDTDTTQPLSWSAETGRGAVAVEPIADQDEIATPAPLPVDRQPGQAALPRARAPGLLWALTILALIGCLASLALNGFLIYSLVSVRQTAMEGLDAAIAAVDEFGGEGFRYDYRFEKTIPISADIPIEQDIIFPFEGTFPINTTVEVPIDAGVLGTFVVEVPINTSVYVNTSVPIHVEQTFHVDTTIPVDMTIPIEVQPDDPEIVRLLSQVRGWLVRLRSVFY